MTILRDKNTTQHQFKKTLDEVAMLLAYEVTANLAVKETSIETPLQKTTGYTMARPLVLVPILRAGLGFLEGFTTMIPEAQVGMIGMARDEETLIPETYYAKFPDDVGAADVIVLDPMLATGGSACDAISEIKKLKPKSITMACLVAAPEGLQKLSDVHPDVNIVAVCQDDGLNEHGYILPGLGDAGDRLFGTENR